MPEEQTKGAGSGSLERDCSAASLKAESELVMEHLSTRWWAHKASNRDLMMVMTMVDKLAAVVKRIEKRMPPNDADQQQPPTTHK